MSGHLTWIDVAGLAIPFTALVLIVWLCNRD